MMTGIIGLYIQDLQIIEAFKASCISLFTNQSTNGQIPSNIFFGPIKATVSYGTLTGRVDANTWWIIGTCKLLSENTNFRDQYFELLKPAIYKCLDVLEIWEYNSRGLIYTPLGGNWADEYPTSGYTLYDNVLHYWALKESSTLFQDTALKNKADQTYEILNLNFNSTKDLNERYHPNAYHKMLEQNLAYLPTSFDAAGYQYQWDMAGNALALLLDINQNELRLVQWLSDLATMYKHWMLPAFHPVIFEDSKDWYLLEKNHLYNFKNKPYHFHNGGSWPIFLGWLVHALCNKNYHQVARNIFVEYDKLQERDLLFYEYYTTDSLEAGGTKNLCFSASGWLLMNFSLSK
jgi:hypothetical protein